MFSSCLVFYGICWENFCDLKLFSCWRILQYMFIVRPFFILMNPEFLFCLLLFLLKLSYKDAFYWFSFFRMFYGRGQRYSQVPKLYLSTVMEWIVSNPDSYVKALTPYCDHIWSWELWEAMDWIRAWEWGSGLMISVSL